jgi:hypothetical protein
MPEHGKAPGREFCDAAVTPGGSAEEIESMATLGRRPNRIGIEDRNLGLSLAQAILLAEFGDIIVVHTDSQKQLGERLTKQRKPDTKIVFVVEPVANPRIAV